MTDTSRTSHEDDDMRAELAALKRLLKTARWFVKSARHQAYFNYCDYTRAEVATVFRKIYGVSTSAIVVVAIHTSEEVA